jgi:hypothetical protein
MKVKIIKRKAVKIEENYLYYIDEKGNLCKMKSLHKGFLQGKGYKELLEKKC